MAVCFARLDLAWNKCQFFAECGDAHSETCLSGGGFYCGKFREKEASLHAQNIKEKQA
jgi:hypothetical protein